MSGSQARCGSTPPDYSHSAPANFPAFSDPDIGDLRKRYAAAFHSEAECAFERDLALFVARCTPYMPKGLYLGFIHTRARCWMDFHIVHEEPDMGLAAFVEATDQAIQVVIGCDEGVV
jgi:hypothetical protein